MERVLARSVPHVFHLGAFRVHFCFGCIFKRRQTFSNSRFGATSGSSSKIHRSTCKQAISQQHSSSSSSSSLTHLSLSLSIYMCIYIYIFFFSLSLSLPYSFVQVYLFLSCFPQAQPNTRIILFGSVRQCRWCQLDSANHQMFLFMRLRQHARPMPEELQVIMHGNLWH